MSMFPRRFQVKRARRNVLNYAIENLNATIVDGVLEQFFNNPDCAAKVNQAFGFILNKRGWRFLIILLTRNHALLDRSKFVCTKDNVARIKDVLNKLEIVESCSGYRMNTQWRLYKLTNLTVFPVSIKDAPTGCTGLFYLNPCLKITQSQLKRRQDSQIITTSVCFVHLLCICTQIKNWKRNF